MADEPSLPRIPPSKAAEAIFGPARKRARFDTAALLSNSSDPAVFSSDDDPALDNYAPGRRKKKRYVGAWFAQHPASTDSTFEGAEVLDAASASASASETKTSTSSRTMTLPLSPARHRKRTLERQYDSGVWMGSEPPDSEMLDESIVAKDTPADDGQSPASLASTSSQLSLAPPPAPAAYPAELLPPPPPRQRRVFQRVPSLAVNHAEERAREVIRECIEAGNERVALLGLGLDSLSDATVEPLSGLVPIPVVAMGVAFEQRNPELTVLLSNNQLTRLPGALFRLEHLTILSLRGNGLAELPPAIGQLKNLRFLNVSLNRLRYLPAELLPLIHTSGQGGHLTELLAYPNDFVHWEETRETRETNEQEDSDSEDGSNNGSVAPPSRPPRHPFEKPTRVARSRVRYCDSTGKRWTDFEDDATDSILATEGLAVAPRPPWTTLGTTRTSKSCLLTASRVPTLLEIALGACYGVPQLAELGTLLPPDAPPRLARQLDQALALREAGGGACSQCGRQPLVAPMAEWVEWWEVARVDVSMSHAAATVATAAAAAAAAAAEAAEAAEVAEAEEAEEATEAAEAAAGGGGEAPGATDDVVQLPFFYRGCSWGCGPMAKQSQASTST